MKIGQTISHYQILEELGRGGMGIVYKALDLNLDRTVALKFLPHHLSSDEERKRRFIQEAKAASALDHPNIGAIYEFDETNDGQLFIVMAYYEGEILKDVLKDGPLDIGTLIDIMGQICLGLAAAHKAGIVHRDVKPSNILITKDDDVKIIDFGLAKSSGHTHITDDASTKGTVAYMSPEQTIGESVDFRTDIWSLGVLLYEMVAGELPFKGDYDQAIIYSILKEAPKNITQLQAESADELKAIIHKALAKNPDDRYQDMKQVLNDLRLIGSADSTSADSASTNIKHRSIKRRIVFALAFMFLLFIIAASIIFQRLQPSGNRKVIAVLPFKNLSSDPENDYFSAGITDDIRAQLSKISDLKVISRSSVLQYKENSKSLKEIGKELNVGIVLDGSVRHEENRVRIVAQLADVCTNEQLWTEVYEREMTDIFAIQSDIAEKIAIALQAELTTREKQRIKQKPTESMTAYHYYLKGREYYLQRHSKSNEYAIGFFKKALELDPDYALAYAGLADAYAIKKGFGASQAWIDSAITMSEKAIEIDPFSSEAYNALGNAYNRIWYVKNRYKSIRAAFQKAIELNPNNWLAMVRLADVLRIQGDSEAALKMLKKALSLNPLHSGTYSSIGSIYSQAGDYEKAEHWIREGMSLQPGTHELDASLASLYFQQGMIEKAVAMYEEAVRADPAHQWKRHDMALAYQAQGRSQRAIAELERAMELDSTQEWHYIGLASVYFELGEIDNALAVFAKAHKRGMNNFFLVLNHSLFLSHAGKTDAARAILEKWTGKIPDYRKYFAPVVRFYLGEISESEMQNILKRDYEERLPNGANYFLGLAYLLNLKQDVKQSQRDTLKAVSYLQKFLSQADPADVELPVVRAQLKQVGVQN